MRDQLPRTHEVPNRWDNVPIVSVNGRQSTSVVDDDPIPVVGVCINRRDPPGTCSQDAVSLGSRKVDPRVRPAVIRWFTERARYGASGGSAVQLAPAGSDLGVASRDRALPRGCRNPSNLSYSVAQGGQCSKFRLQLLNLLERSAKGIPLCGQLTNPLPLPRCSREGNAAQAGHRNQACAGRDPDRDHPPRNGELAHPPGVARSDQNRVDILAPASGGRSGLRRH